MRETADAFGHNSQSSRRRRINLLGEDAYTALYPEYQEVIIFKRKMNQKDWGFQWPFERKYLPRCEFLCIFVEKIYLLREDLHAYTA